MSAVSGLASEDPMSEHTPLTEAEVIERLLEDHALHVRTEFGDVAWTGNCTATGCRWTDWGPIGGRAAAGRAHRRHVAELLAARTSTATADTGPTWDCVNFTEPATCLSAGVTETARCGRCRLRLLMAQETVRLAGATADTGLRERVEALAEECEREEKWLVRWYSPDSCVSESAAMRLRDILDATAAPTSECEHDPVYDRTIYECGHAHGYCRHCGETTEPCAPTTDTGASDE